MSVDRRKSRLGRGLDSLLSVGTTGLAEEGLHLDALDRMPESHADDVPRGTPLELPLAQIVANPRQPRRTFDDTTLAELAESIRANGVIQPIVVRSVGIDRYELIAGERRLRAARIAGLSAIPAILKSVDDLTQAQLALVENIQREDLNPIDRALGYQTLLSELGLTQAELASRLGEERTGITNHLRLLDLAGPVRDMVRSGQLSLGHAKVLAGLNDADEQLRLAQIVAGQGLSVRNLERLLSEAPKARPEKTAPSPHIKELETTMTRSLGMRVQVRSGTNKTRGRVVIHYANLDQFDALCSKLGVALDVE
jgi:ParB family chromosome partitioning protein